MFRISDVTMKQEAEGFSLSFKEKIELAKLLDRLGVNVIELEGIKKLRTDSLRIKSIASIVNDSVIAVPVELSDAGITDVWNALQYAKKPRLQVCAPVSSVQMEYLYHKKPEAMLETVQQAVKNCSSLCETEFVANDATRSEPTFLYQIIAAAIASGATVITVSDSAGVMLPAEFAEFVRNLYANIPQLQQVQLAVSCSDNLTMADACTISAISEGVTEVKAAAYPIGTASVANIARILNEKKDVFGKESNIRITQLSRIVEQIAWLCQSGKNTPRPADMFADDSQDLYITAQDDVASVVRAAESMGYDLSEEDSVKVYEAFRAIAEKKDKVSVKELDAIIASVAMQVPPTFKLDTYLITSGNTISSTAHLKLTKGDAVLEGACIGSGPIDAAFMGIEQITGCHYELDDFQIQSITEGREAMGQTMVKLRHNGKVYAGRGISTDIVGASIRAYLSALNKIVYEEDEQ